LQEGRVAEEGSHDALLAKVLGYSLAMTPRWGRIRIMAMVMRGMTKHHAA
jgi:hypothetical protein